MTKGRRKFRVKILLTQPYVDDRIIYGDCIKSENDSVLICVDSIGTIALFPSKHTMIEEIPQ